MSYSQVTHVSIVVPVESNKVKEQLSFIKEIPGSTWIVQPPTDTRADMEASYAAQEDVFDGFIGGIEKPVAFLDNVAHAEFQPDPDNPKTWGELLPHKISLDGTKALIRVCLPGAGNKNWIGITNELFYKYADSQGIDKILTNDEALALRDGPDYTDPEEA